MPGAHRPLPLLNDECSGADWAAGKEFMVLLCLTTRFTWLMGPGWVCGFRLSEKVA